MPHTKVTSIHAVERLIHVIRNQKVILDSALADLYGVPTKALLQGLRRNRERFPKDFVFQLSQEEMSSLRSQIVTSKRGGRRYRPYGFTEQGVAMLSSVLRSERAVRVNIAIMRAFVRLRKAIGENKRLAEQLAKLESKVTGHGRQIASIFEAIRQLMEPPATPRKRIGF